MSDEEKKEFLAHQFKSGYVTIIGRPNVGKSTLLNGMIGQKISAISNKPQTTRQNITFIYTDDACQIVFIDTPGIQNPKNKLGKFMLQESESTLREVDIITYMVDTSKTIGKMDRYILDGLKELKMDQKIVLLINKIDMINKLELFEIIEMYAKERLFSDIIPISAKDQDGVNTYLSVLRKYLPQGPMYYPDDMVTDKSERFIAEEIIREKALHYLQEEVPHGIAVSIENFKERSNKKLFDIEANIYVEKESHKGIIIGKHGDMLKKIGIAARKDIENMMETKVNLKLWVKVEKNWREKENKVKHFGYQ
ncbi:MAG: GTPase Era [Tissierellia bacterium]|nr:GTPase Era [Tissierellia bacterium]